MLQTVGTPTDMEAQVGEQSGWGKENAPVKVQVRRGVSAANPEIEVASLVEVVDRDVKKVCLAFFSIGRSLTNKSLAKIVGDGPWPVVPMTRPSTTDFICTI